VDVRPARRADIGELSHVLARAFYDDPVAKWEVPDDVVRKGKLHHWWTALIRHHHLGGRRARSRGTRRDDQRGRGVGSARPMALPATRRTEDDAPAGLGVRLGPVTQRGADRGDEERPPGRTTLVSRDRR